MSRSSASSTVVVTVSAGLSQTVLSTTSGNTLSASTVDLTAYPVVSKSSREAWRARHKKQPGQGNASTSGTAGLTLLDIIIFCRFCLWLCESPFLFDGFLLGSVSTRPNTQLQSTAEATLNGIVSDIGLMFISREEINGQCCR